MTLDIKQGDFFIDDENSLWKGSSLYDLYKIASKNNFNAIQSKNIKDALKKIETKEKKIIVIFGSLYLVGNALSIN